MNGIIHVCSHPEDENPHFRITEEKIFADIFHYIEVRFPTAAFILCVYCHYCHTKLTFVLDNCGVKNVD